MSEFNMKHSKQSYVPPGITVWELTSLSNLLNYLSTEGEVIDLLPGDATLTDDEWDQFS